MARSMFISIILIMFFLYAKGQEKTDWIKSQVLEASGYYENLGLTKEKKSVGIIFENTSKAAKRFILKVNNPHVNHLYLYSKNGDTIYNTGDHINFSSRPIVFWDFAFPIEVKSNSKD